MYTVRKDICVTAANGLSVRRWHTVSEMTANSPTSSPKDDADASLLQIIWDAGEDGLVIVLIGGKAEIYHIDMHNINICSKYAITPIIYSKTLKNIYKI